MPTKSGLFWVTWANANAKNSKSIDDLANPFRDNVIAFKNALEDAGATIEVTTTRRSDKRAYLFHWSWLIGLGKIKAAEAESKAGVDIEWDHGNADASRRGAKEMIDGFGLAVPPESTNAPALKSKHISGTAIDMEIKWKGTINAKNRDGIVVAIAFMQDVNENTLLHQVGASYGVKKLATDAPHWSNTGR
jgi:hypothetical protein